MTDTPSDPRYALSFTTGALLAREGALLAPVYVEVRDWEKARDLAEEDNFPLTSSGAFDLAARLQQYRQVKAFGVTYIREPDQMTTHA